MLLSLLLTNFFLIVTEANFKFLILHTGDIHGEFDETYEDDKLIGGCSRIDHIVKQDRKNSDHLPVLYFDTGDVYAGNIRFAEKKHELTSKFMNELKPDAMCLGTHEFDFGLISLIPFLEKLNFPVVISNLVFNEELTLKMLIQKFILIELKGVQIGVVGYISKAKAEVASRKGTIQVLDEVEAVKNITTSLHAQGVNVIIALGHAGIEVDELVAKHCEHVDVIIGGKSHILMWNGKPPSKDIPGSTYPKMVGKNGKKVPIVHAFQNARYVGRLVVEVDDFGEIIFCAGQPIFLNQDVPQDKQMMVITERYRKKMARFNNLVIGKTNVYLDGKSCVLKECNFGNLIADALVNYRVLHFKGNEWTDAPIALINAGAMRGGINASARGRDVYKGDITTAIPHFNMLYVISLRSEHLRWSLEQGVKSTQKKKTALLITSGLRVVYDFKKPPGQRVISVKVRCSLCDVPKYVNLTHEITYRLVTTDYLIAGGDEHLRIKEQSREKLPLNVSVVDAVIEYFKGHGTVLTGLDGRIIIRNPPSFAERVRVGFSTTNLMTLLILIVAFQ